MEVMRMKIPRAASLPDDLIAAILLRVPYPSLCRFKCVSRLWLSICSDPGIRRKCPQTLSGFFFLGEELCPSGYAPRFVNASGRGRAMVDPSLSFLPPSHRDMTIVDSCNGLLLCCRLNPRGDVSCYFVCNPATRRWIELPGSEATMNPSLSAAIRLGFDPAVSSHFKVFCVHNEKDFAVLDRRTEVGIYSSETGAWTYRQIEWDDAAIVNGSSKSVFFNGTLHLTTLDPLLSSVDFPEVDTLHLTTLDSFLSSVEFPEEEDDTLHLTTLESSLVTVGMDGKTWRRIPTPRNFDFIGASQGHLYVRLLLRISAAAAAAVATSTSSPLALHLKHALRIHSPLLRRRLGHIVRRRRGPLPAPPHRLPPVPHLTDPPPPPPLPAPQPLRPRRQSIYICLGFDPAVSSHFRVFALVKAQNPFDLRDLVTGMEIYSSETGAWTYRPSEWGNGTVASCHSVFCNGTLHLISHGSASLLTVVIEGRTWGKIPTPRDFDFVGVSQGHLYAVHISDRGNDDKLSIWVLEDYAGQQWIKKHAVSARQMFGTRPRSFGDSYSFEVQAIHPEHSLIFLTAGKLSSLMSYDMDKKRVRFIWTLGENNEPAYPYVPCFSDWLLLGQH
ncbi:unnamed protein product [Urochloa decumbens]|uniref:F-box domain-containing protein n=1 Tax=Urochloa decumbens TaxID=240449 RepID=A0ABC8VPC8_9POAL